MNSHVSKCGVLVVWMHVSLFVSVAGKLSEAEQHMA